MENLAHIDVNIPFINNFTISFNNKSNLWLDISNIDEITGTIYKYMGNNPFHDIYDLTFNSHINEKIQITVPSKNKVIQINGYNIPELVIQEIKEIANIILDYKLATVKPKDTSQSELSSLNTEIGRFSTREEKYTTNWLQPLLNKVYSRTYTSIVVLFHDTKYPFKIDIETDYKSYIIIYYKEEKIDVIHEDLTLKYYPVQIIQRILPIIYNLYDYHEAWNKTPDITNIPESNTKKSVKPKEILTGKCVIFNNNKYLIEQVSNNAFDWNKKVKVDKDSKYLFKENEIISYKITPEYKLVWSEALNTKLKKTRRFRLPRLTNQKVAKILTLNP